MTTISDFKSLIEEDFWPEMEREVRKTWDKDKDQIRIFSKNQNISRLCHFTKVANLKSIFDNGVKSRQALKKLNIEHDKIDKNFKIYFQDFVYISITSPNTKMIHSKFISGTPFAIIVMHIKLLWKQPFFSIPMNSARKELVTNIRNDYSKYLGIIGLKNLYSNRPLRSKFAIHSSEPTDLQSELIFLDPIPAKYFKTILITPIDKTSKEFLTLAKNFEFFDSGVIQKYEFKWLEEETIKTWGPGNSIESRLIYNERNWNEDWLNAD